MENFGRLGAVWALRFSCVGGRRDAGSGSPVCQLGLTFGVGLIGLLASPNEGDHSAHNGSATNHAADPLGVMKSCKPRDRKGG